MPTCGGLVCGEEVCMARFVCLEVQDQRCTGRWEWAAYDPDAVTLLGSPLCSLNLTTGFRYSVSQFHRIPGQVLFTLRFLL